MARTRDVWRVTAFIDNGLPFFVMFTTTFLIAFGLGLLALTLVLSGIFLRLGLRWGNVKPEDITRKKVILTTVIAFVLQIALSALFTFVIPAGNSWPLQLALALTAFIVASAATCFVISRTFTANFKQSLVAWLATLIPIVSLCVLTIVLSLGIVFETFTSPSNGMAPTLLGPHVVDVCPVCGRPAYRSPSDARMRPARGQTTAAICESFHNTEVPDVAGDVQPADKFLMARFLSPRRWDLIVFELPEDRSVLFVERVIGLPGETITIEDGAIFVNGEPVELPEHLEGIEYVSEHPEERERFGPVIPPLWGSAAAPAVLGDDEYFVLGDFTNRSADSRYWTAGAQGHPPYAVPESHLRGVVTLIYWPTSRWRVLR